MIFYSHSNITHFHNKSFVLSLVLKVRVFVTREWPIEKAGLIEDLQYVEEYPNIPHIGAPMMC